MRDSGIPRDRTRGRRGRTDDGRDRGEVRYDAGPGTGRRSSEAPRHRGEPMPHRGEEPPPHRGEEPPPHRGEEPPPHRGDEPLPHRGEEAVARQIEPNRVDVERRAGEDRRVADHPVDVERRQADRRAEAERAALESRERRAYIVARVTQGVDYLFYLLYGLLGIRFVLSLLGASEQAGFVQFVMGLTQPFYGPFAGIVARPAVNGGFLDFPLLIAVLAYALLHMAIRGLLRLVAGTKTTF